jgi:hypothetical protein
MKRAIFIAALSLATSAHAGELVMHATSWHSRGEYCNQNAGLGYLSPSGWMAGAYRNSYDRPSAYAGGYAEWQVGPVKVGGIVVLATGYGAPRPLSAAMVSLPLVGDTHLRVLVAPKLGGDGATVVHGMIGVPW